MQRVLLSLGVSVALIPFVAAACGSFSEGAHPPPDDAGATTNADASSEAGAEPVADAAAESDAKAPRDGAAGCGANANCERVVFATSMQFDPNELAGVKGAHARCNEAASADGAHPRVKGRTFLAWLSDATSSPDTIMTKGTAAYVLPSGEKVADDWADLIDGTIDHAIDEDESGAAPATNVVWTGTSMLGLGSGLHCAGWTDVTSGMTATVGSTLETSGDWTATQADTCDQDHRIYCFEE